MNLLLYFRSRRCLARLAWMGWLVLLVMGRAPSAGAADPLVQTESSQEQLRTSTDRVAGQLDVILEEFQRNGLAGEEVDLLGSIRGVLGQLSEEDMARVIGLLQEARGEAGQAPQRSRLLEAFSTQKSVGLKLRQILLEYERQQELAGISARMEELAHRQHGAMRDTFGLASASAGRKRDWLSENQRITLQLLQSEQQSLREEVRTVLERLRTWSGEEGDEEVDRAREAMQQAEAARLRKVMEAITADLEAGLLLSATGLQREARGLLRELARQLLPPPDELDALRTALLSVEALIGRQQETRQQTRALTDRAAEHARVTREQADLVDDTDQTRGVVSRLDSSAAEQVSGSIGRMQEARGLLEGTPAEARSRRLGAGTQQELALSRLESARRLLKERIDTLEKQRAAATDPLSNLRQVREDVADLLKREQALKDDAAKVENDATQLRPLAPPQGDLGDRAEDVGQRAALDAPAAAQQIAEATAEMRRSQKALGEGRNDAGAQQAAVDALARALSELDQQLAALEAAQKELEELQELLARLIALIERQQAMNDETARLARALPGRTPEEAGREQNEMAAEARDIEGKVPPSVPQAATYLSDAGTQMVLAGNELGSRRAGEARPPQDEALLNLMRARRELEDRMAQLQEALGQTPEGASLEELAQRIKEAQQDVNSAMSAEAMQRMSAGLKDAKQQIRPATSGRMGRMPRSVREPLQRADQALQEAAAAAEAGDRPAADGDAASAQEALAAASAALDLAMAGMGQQPGQGEGQGGEGQSMGQGEGQGRGKMPGNRPGKGTGDAGNFFGAGGADGPRRSQTGAGRFIGLPAREREALLQSQGERYPQEYAPMIEQYLKNLSDRVAEPTP